MLKKTLGISAVLILIGVLVGAGAEYVVLTSGSNGGFSPPDVYLDSIPATSTYVIRNNGTYTYAVNWNGKIDFYGEDAGAVINQAINASETHKIFLKYAIYNISTPIIAHSDLEIDAEPSTEIRRTADNNYLLDIESETNVRVRNLVFNGANVLTSSPNEYYGLIYIKNSYMVTLDHLEIRNVGKTLAGRPTSGIFVSLSHDIRIYDSYIHDNQGSGIYIGQETLYGDRPYNIYIQGNTVNDNTLQYVCGVFGAVVLTNVQNSTIAFNKIRRATWGLEVVGEFKWNTIIGNEILGSANQSVVDEDGIEIYGEGSIGNKIIGNTLANWGSDYAPVGSAIQVGEFYLNYTGEGASRNEVVGNTVILTKKGRGITINGKYNAVTENTVERGDADEDAIGILEAGVSDYNKIMNNDVTTILRVDKRIIRVGRNTTIRFNSGYKTEASGLASITGNVDGVWVAHGLIYTPLDGFPQVTALQSGQGDYWVGYKNQTHFYIRFTNKPGEAWWGFDWYAET